ncbi:unnamed protein product [Trichobilharzia szidati]|nr:unnamed protein product [Trichobilharzia szidati]
MFNNYYLLCIVIIYELLIIDYIEVKRHTEDITSSGDRQKSLRNYVQIDSQYEIVMRSSTEFNFQKSHLEPRSVQFTKYDIANMVNVLLTSRTIYFSIEFIMINTVNDTGARQTLISIIEKPSKLILFKVSIQNRNSHKFIQLTMISQHKFTTRYKSHPVELNPNQWYKLTFDIEGLNKADLQVNCQPIAFDITRRRSIIIFNQWKSLRMPRIHMNDKYWLMMRKYVGFLGQLDEHKEYWKGSIRNFMLTSNQDVIKSELSQCPSWILSKSLNRDSPIPVAVSNLPHMRSQYMNRFGGEYIAPLNKMDASSQFTNTINELYSMLNTQKHAIERLMQQVSELNMKVASREQCLCIPNCGKSAHGIPYLIGNTWKPDACSQCECTLAGALCTQKKCPILNCTNSIRIQDECCPHCPANCHFMGQVYPHGESLMRGCIQCVCMNGTMKCREINQTLYCPPLNCSQSEQIQPADSCCKICRKINVCAHKHNKCHPLAKCIPNGMTYHCECPTGYSGSGDLITGCTPECRNNCSNHGVCISPNKCQCYPGFGGSECDYDLNECNMRLDLCSENSTCLNLPGSYTCVCHDGFEPTASSQLNKLNTTEPMNNNTITNNSDMSNRQEFDSSTGHVCQRVSLCHGYQGIYLNCPNGTLCDENQGKYMCKQSVSSNTENETEERINSTVYNTSCSVGYHRMYSNQSLDTLNEIPNDQFKQLIYSTDNRENKLLCYCQSGQLECIQHPDYSLLLLIQSVSTDALYINQSVHHHHLHENQLCRICSKLQKSSQRELSLNLSKWYVDYCILCSFMDNMTAISNFTYWWVIEQNPSLPPLPPPPARWENHSLCKICIELNNTQYCQPLLCSSFMAFTSIEYYQLCCSNTIPLKKKQLNSTEQTTSLSHLNKCTNSRLASSLKSMSTLQCIDCQCVNDRIYCTLNATQIYQRDNVTVECDQLLSTLQRDSLLIPMKYIQRDKSGDGR